MIYPDLPYDQAGGHGGQRGQTQMVVVHATFNTASDEAEAHYAEHRSDQVSAHFYNDGDSIIQALDTDVVAYGCFPIGNSRSVQFELTGLDWDHNPPGPGAVADATMRQAARIVARVCRQYGIPVRKIGPADLRAGARGICGHADVTLAWGQGDHMDPGSAFPWARFLSYVAGTATTTGGTDVALRDDPDGLWMFPRVQAIALRQPPINGPEAGHDLPVLRWMQLVEEAVAKIGTPAPVVMSAADKADIVADIVAELAPLIADLKTRLAAGARAEADALTQA